MELEDPDWNTNLKLASISDRGGVSDRLLSVDSFSSMYNGEPRKSFLTRVQDTILHAIDDEYADDDRAAKLNRRKLFIRSIYSEFICTSILMIGIFGTIANCYQANWDPSSTAFVAAIASGFGTLTMTFAFSDISGAQMNCAITFALWFTGKLSNRKLVSYMIIQLISSIVSAGAIYCAFSNPTKDMFYAINVRPHLPVDLPRLVFTEFLSTFILSYVAFTVAFNDAQRYKKEVELFQNSIVDLRGSHKLSNLVKERKESSSTANNNVRNRSSTINTLASEDGMSNTAPAFDGLAIYATNPQSKSGFAPFAIGLTVFILSLFGGSSGISMNPVRMLGPAIFSGYWDNFYLYVVAEFLGAAVAAWLVQNIHKLGLKN